MTTLSVTYLLLWLIVCLWSIRLRNLLNHVIELKAQMEGRVPTWLPVGASVPKLSLATGDGKETRNLQDYRSTWFFFTSAGESADKWPEFLGTVGYLHKKAQPERLVIVLKGSPEECVWFSEALSASAIDVLRDQDQAASQAFRLDRTPMTVRVDSQGRVAGYGYQKQSAREDSMEGKRSTNFGEGVLENV